MDIGLTKTRQTLVHIYFGLLKMAGVPQLDILP